MEKIILQTKRLFLREMVDSDFDSIYAILADPQTMMHYPRPYDSVGVHSWISRNRERYEKYGFGLWSVCLKENGEVIGDCGLTIQSIDGEDLPEIGYHIRKDMQRLGYAKEACIAVRNWAFENTTYNALYSYMKHTNLASERTAVSYGARLVKTYADPVNEYTKVYCLRREDWVLGL